MFPYCTCQEHARQGQDIDRFDQIRSRLAFEQVHENRMRPPRLRSVEWVHVLFLFPLVLGKMQLPHAKLDRFCVV